MESMGQSTQRRRIVVLGSAAAASLEAAAPLDIVPAESGYDAAVELLLAPADLLVVDLARLYGAHAGLIGLAEAMGVPVVAFGIVPVGLSAEALAGVRLVASDRLAGAVAEVLKLDKTPRPPSRDDSGPETPPGNPGPTGTSRFAPTQPFAQKLAPQAPAAQDDREPAAEEPKPEPVERKPLRARAQARPLSAKGAPPRPRKLSSALTPDELDALLGEGP